MKCNLCKKPIEESSHPEKGVNQCGKCYMGIAGQYKGIDKLQQIEGALKSFERLYISYSPGVRSLIKIIRVIIDE